MSEDEEKNEYEYFFSKFPIQAIQYRTEPHGDVLKPKSNILKMLKSVLTADFKNVLFPIHTHEPLTNTQRPIEMMIHYKLLNLAAEQTDIVDTMAYIAAFIISLGYSFDFGRNLQTFDSIEGETFEFVDPEEKVLFMSEQVSESPQITACYAKGEKWELSYCIQFTSHFKITKIRVDWNTEMVIKFRDGNIFTAHIPDLFIHDITSANPWLELKGDVLISHSNTPAKVEINFAGCTKYSTNDCVRAKMYDENGLVDRELSGSYLTKVIYKKDISKSKDPTNKSVEIWNRGEDFNMFPNYFGHNTHGLKMNDHSYSTDCLTDARHRLDVQYLEHGEFDKADAENIAITNRKREEDQRLAKEGKTFEPRWFKKEVKSNENKTEYVYNHKYWITKANNEFDQNYKPF